MYDVIVVGARISGSGVACLLARAGYRVLLVDRARFPSATASETNLIHPAGVAALRRLGVLDRLAGMNVPRITRYGLRSGPVSLEAELPEVDGVGYALSPPRAELDHAMVLTAVEAGAELREGTNVQELLRDDDGRVVGVAGSLKGGRTFTEKASLVIGADGKNSRVAALVGAVSYRDHPVLGKSHWTYWEGLPQDSLVRTYRGSGVHPFTWPTHDGLSIVGVARPTAGFPSGAADEEIDRLVVDAFATVDPDLSARLRDTRRAGRWLTGAVPNFLRTSHGPGWALVGDAGATRDPITASGITFALRSAELLAEQVDSALAGRVPQARALAAYGIRRDALLSDHHDYTRDYARIAPHSPEERALIEAMARSQRHARGMVGVFSTAVPPAEFYTRASFRDLFDYLNDDRRLPLSIRALRLLLDAAPGAPGALVDRAVAARLGPMGRLLLSSPVPGRTDRTRPSRTHKEHR
ncbi:FAD-dependent monooxygenase (plasmid) [Streptomyces sp. BI20]|uniref:FAD-dependent monooxygenase n=1 Tax=Streptomyces sp. BI20 TaxID=3403460 RepID=UPI003C782763